MSEPQVTVDDLLKKIGALVVQLELAQSQLIAHQSRISDLESENSKLKEESSRSNK